MESNNANQLLNILTNEWLMIPIIAGIVFILTYMWSNKIIDFLYRKSLGQREEVIELLNKMFVETNQKKITIAMLLLSFGFGGLIFILLWPKIFPGLLLGSTLTIIGWSIPKNIVKMVYEKRSAKFVDQMVDGMTIMANGIKSGLSITESMQRVADTMGNPISQEFNLVLSQIKVGRSTEEALNELGERIPKPDVQIFVTTTNLLKETGGRMAEACTTIMNTIRERQKVEKKIQALTAQGITQGIIISLVPFFLLIVFLFLDPAYIKPLFSTTLGIFIFLSILALQLIGGLVIRKIVKIDV